MTRCILPAHNDTPCAIEASNYTPFDFASEDDPVDVAIHLYVISVLCFIGLLGNACSLVVLRCDKERKEALFLLQALAVADGLYLVAAVLRHPLKFMLPEEDFILMQVHVYPLLKTCQTITIWMMVLVTVDRFVYVCKPTHAHHLLQDNRRVRRVAAGSVFVVACLYNVPRFVDSCVMTFAIACSNVTRTVSTYRQEFNNQIYYDLYLSGMYLVFLYVGPLTILCFMNVRLIQAIKFSRRRNRDVMGIRATSEQGENNATNVLIIIVLIFILCETPELINNLILVIDRYTMDSVKIYGKFMIHINTVSEVLLVVNSSVNFFIYFGFGKRFRQVFREKIVYRFTSDSTAITHEVLPLHNYMDHKHYYPHNRFNQLNHNLAPPPQPARV